MKYVTCHYNKNYNDNVRSLHRVCYIICNGDVCEKCYRSSLIYTLRLHCLHILCSLVIPYIYIHRYTIFSY